MGSRRCGLLTVATSAVVLGKIPYGESDLIVTLYTRDFGKLSAIARHARQSKRRFAGSLESLAKAKVRVKERRGSELWTLSQSTVECSYLSLASNMDTFVPATYATELVRELTAREQPSSAIFDLLEHVYQLLSCWGPNLFMMRAFELQLLKLLGLAPETATCVACAKRRQMVRKCFWDPGRGGTICVACAGQVPEGTTRAISDGALDVLDAAQRDDLESCYRAEWPIGDLREARNAILRMVLSHIGKPLRSLEFIGKLPECPA